MGGLEASSCATAMLVAMASLTHPRSGSRAIIKAKNKTRMLQ